MLVGTLVLALVISSRRWSSSIKNGRASFPLYCVTVGSHNSRAGNGEARNSTRSSSSQLGNIIGSRQCDPWPNLFVPFLGSQLRPTGSSNSEKTDCTSGIFPPKLFWGGEEGKWGSGGMLPRKIVKFRLHEKSFCAFSDEFEPKLNWPSYTSLTSFSARNFDQILNCTWRSLVFRESLQEWCDLHPFEQSRQLQVQLCCRLQRQKVRKR